MAGQYLTGDVTYTAKWKEPKNVNGYVDIATTYQLEGKIVDVNDRDLPEYVVIVLQKLVNSVYDEETEEYTEEYIDINAKREKISYSGWTGSATYNFSVPADGSKYRIHILELNYTSKYDNNGE